MIGAFLASVLMGLADRSILASGQENALLVGVLRFTSFSLVILFISGFERRLVEARQLATQTR